MKTKSLIAILLVFVNVFAFGQVPQNIKDAFKNKYPGAVVKKFRHKGGDYVAKFVDNGQKYTATFSENSTWVQTTTKKKLKDIPKAIKEEVKSSNYSGWYIQNCNRIETPHGVMYSLDVTSPEIFTGSFKGDHYIYFTPSGKMIK